MSVMRTITQSIQGILDDSPLLTEALSDGIVNYSAVARKLKPDLEKIHLRPFTDGAIIMALRKLRRSSTPIRMRWRAFETVRGISVHSNLVEHSFRNSRSLLTVQQDLLEHTKRDGDLVIYMARGTVDTSIILSEDLEPLFLLMTKNFQPLAMRRKLSSVSIRFIPSIIDVPGVYYPFFQALAWRGINIVQIVTGFAELTLIFDEADIERAFSAIKTLTTKK